MWVGTDAYTCTHIIMYSMHRCLVPRRVALIRCIVLCHQVFARLEQTSAWRSSAKSSLMSLKVSFSLGPSPRICRRTSSWRQSMPVFCQTQIRLWHYLVSTGHHCMYVCNVCVGLFTCMFEEHHFSLYNKISRQHWYMYMYIVVILLVFHSKTRHNICNLLIKIQDLF